MDLTNAPFAVDDFEEHLVEMTSNQSTREEMLAWLSQKGVEISLRTLNRRLAAWQTNRRTWTYTKLDKDQLTEIVDRLFQCTRTVSVLVSRSDVLRSWSGPHSELPGTRTRSRFSLLVPSMTRRRDIRRAKKKG